MLSYFQWPQALLLTSDSHMVSSRLKKWPFIASLSPGSNYMYISVKLKIFNAASSQSSTEKKKKLKVFSYFSLHVLNLQCLSVCMTTFMLVYNAQEEWPTPDKKKSDGMKQNLANTLQWSTNWERLRDFVMSIEVSSDHLNEASSDQSPTLP